MQMLLIEKWHHIQWEMPHLRVRKWSIMRQVIWIEKVFLKLMIFEIYLEPINRMVDEIQNFYKKWKILKILCLEILLLKRKICNQALIDQKFRLMRPKVFGLDKFLSECLPWLLWADYLHLLLTQSQFHQ